MKSSSNNKPNEIESDFGSLYDGRLDLLIHWDMIEKVWTTQDGQSYTYWDYQEERIRVDVPTSDQAGIQAYINDNSDRFFRLVGAPAPSDVQWRSDVELALLDLAGVL
jgi:hypothetical protein